MNETPAGVNYGSVLEGDLMLDAETKAHLQALRHDMPVLNEEGMTRLRPWRETFHSIPPIYFPPGEILPMAGGGGTTTESPRDMEKTNEQAVDRVVEYLAGKKGALHPKHIDQVESAVQKARSAQSVGRAIARGAFRHSAGLDPTP